MMTIREAINIKASYIEAVRYYNNNAWLIDEPFNVWYDGYYDIPEADSVLNTVGIDLEAVEKYLRRMKAKESESVSDFKIVELGENEYFVEKSDRRFVDRVFKHEKNDDLSF